MRKRRNPFLVCCLSCGKDTTNRSKYCGLCMGNSHNKQRPSVYDLYIADGDDGGTYAREIENDELKEQEDE